MWPHAGFIFWLSSFIVLHISQSYLNSAASLIDRHCMQLQGGEGGGGSERGREEVVERREEMGK